MNSAPPGWNPDPTGRHEYRYWDGTAWTDDVSDGGVAATDPLGGAAPGGGEPTAPFDSISSGEPPAPSEPTAPYDPTAPYEPTAPYGGQHPGGYMAPGQGAGGYGGAADQGYSGLGGPPGAPDAYGGAPPPPSRPGRSGPPVGLLVGLGVLALIVVVVLVVVLTRDDGDDTATDDTTTTTATTDDTEPETTNTAAPETTVAGPEDADVFSLGVGDCLVEETPDGEVQSLPVVPCDQPHASEIYYVHIIDADGLPGADEMESIARDECLPQFETFVGVPYEQSALLVTWLEPTEASWDAGDRELLCIAVDPEGDATGSFAGTAR
ncbi:MAG TPA: septum formation family protein [Acidimicrobiales bacterium]